MVKNFQTNKQNIPTGSENLSRNKNINDNYYKKEIKSSNFSNFQKGLKKSNTFLDTNDEGEINNKKTREINKKSGLDMTIISSSCTNNNNDLLISKDYMKRETNKKYKKTTYEKNKQ